MSLRCSDPTPPPHPSFGCVLQEIRNLHNEQLMGIRREEEMEMSDDDMEDTPDSKDSEDSGMRMCIHTFTVQHFCQRDGPYADHDLQRMSTESIKKLREAAVFDWYDRDHPPSSWQLHMNEKHIQSTSRCWHTHTPYWVDGEHNY